MTIQNIIDKWTTLGETLNPLTSKSIDTLGLKQDTVDFLKNCGFPNQSAPFLSFVKNSDHTIQTINRLSDLYELSTDFDKYIRIGSDGGGNPIVINTSNNDKIELLDHEQDFELLVLMNSNVFSFSRSLIEYNVFVKTILKENGPDAFLDANFTDEQFRVLKSGLVAIDKQAAEFGFWKMELDMLESNRDYYRKNPN